MGKPRGKPEGKDDVLGERPPAAAFGPAPSLDDPPPVRASQARTVRVSAVKVAVNSGQYVIDKDAVARNLVDEELAPKVK